MKNKTDTRLILSDRNYGIQNRKLNLNNMENRIRTKIVKISPGTGHVPL
jgi:hypothetical protein